MVQVPQVQIPDFTATLMRGEQMQQSRLQALAAQQALDDAARFDRTLADIAPALAAGEGPGYDSALARLMGAGRQGFAMALPLQQQRQQRREYDAWTGGGAPQTTAPPSGGGGGVRTGAAIDVPGNLDDADIFARTILGEAANQGEVGQRAVAAVIRNRMAQTGRGLRDVVLAPNQFEPWGARRQELLAIPTTDPRYIAARRLAEEALAGRIEDPTGGATHFLNPDLQRQLGRQQPSWAPEGQGRRIGAHVFYTPGGGIVTAPGGASPPAGGNALPAQNAAPGGASRTGIDPAELRRIEQGLASPNPLIQRAAQARLQALQFQMRDSPQQGERERLLQRYGDLVARGDSLTPAERAQRDALAGYLAGNNVNVRLEQGPQVGTIPPGYQLERTPEGSLRMAPIPGGPGERESRAANARREGEQRTGNVVLQDLDRTLELLRSANLPVAGFGAGTLARVPGTAAADAARLLDSIRANVGFAQLNQMRQESPTGGALGSVTERELAFLQSVLGSLDQTQSAGQFRDNLVRLRNAFLDIVHGEGNGPQRLRPSFQRDQNATPAGARRPDATPEIPGPGGQGVASPPPAATTRRYNPATGRIE